MEFVFTEVLYDSVEVAVIEVFNLYRVYHSMPYIRSNPLLRLQHKLSDE